MNFWDASAIVPLIVEQSHTVKAEKIITNKDANILWWGTSIECLSAIARLTRESRLSSEESEQAIKNLKKLCTSWHEVTPSTQVKDKASRLLRIHNLRAGDALQLAAAQTASKDMSFQISFICFDERLANVAKLEGFNVIS